ncbi:MAG: lipoyl synthase [Planctomycetia bacterium]|nr:lipoyl synthase [Planctomycetia bacterium]
MPSPRTRRRSRAVSDEKRFGVSAGLLPILPNGADAAPVPAAARRLPPWLRQNLAPGGGHAETAHLIAELNLETVCSSAKCPNRLECWSQRTATFMILGNVCTRPCGFCSVPKGKTEALELDEPERVAEAARRLGLEHVVITSVTRDDLPDGGAEHFRRTVEAVREATGAAVEVLVPDFLDKPGALERLMEAKPDVFNHNTETVPRLYRSVRGRKSVYAWTLRLLADAKRIMPEVKTKSGLMLGLGETRDELLDVFADLVDHGVDFLTLGQYLQPTLDSLPVERYVPPEEFDELGAIARGIGFKKVASGPLVRSSYHAREMTDDGRVS